ncbi:hypothetical protein CR513_58052, partial [Mucuna pruriens]
MVSFWTLWMSGEVNYVYVSQSLNYDDNGLHGNDSEDGDDGNEGGNDGNEGDICDGSSSHTNVEGDFDTNINVNIDAHPHQGTHFPRLNVPSSWHVRDELYVSLRFDV